MQKSPKTKFNLIMENMNRREVYSSPECFVFSYSHEQSILSGFEPEDWGRDPDELG